MRQNTRSIYCFMLFRFVVGELCLYQRSAAAQEPAQKAEQAVQRFYQALFSQRWKDAAAAMHPEGLATFRTMFVHIAETTDNVQERQQLMQMAGGVNTLAAFKKVDPQLVFVRIFTTYWKQFSPEYQTMWQHSRIQIIGSVKEGDIYHVVIRTFADIADGHGHNSAGSIVSVASAKKDGSTWKLLSSMEMQKMAQKSLP